MASRLLKGPYHIYLMNLVALQGILVKPSKSVSRDATALCVSVLFVEIKTKLASTSQHDAHICIEIEATLILAINVTAKSSVTASCVYKTLRMGRQNSELMTWCWWQVEQVHITRTVQWKTFRHCNKSACLTLKYLVWIGFLAALNTDLLSYTDCGAGCGITMSPKHVVYKKVSRDKSVSCCCFCCWTPAVKRCLRWFRESNTVRTVFQVAVYMGKRDFVDHCDFVDPVGERSTSMLSKFAEVKCAACRTKPLCLSYRWSHHDRPAAAQREERLVFRSWLCISII